MPKLYYNWKCIIELEVCHKLANNDLHFSYTPKNTAPPTEIHVTLGVTPANKPVENIKIYKRYFLSSNENFHETNTLPLTPFSLTTILQISKVPDLASTLPAPANIILVLATSSGVVIAADIPPDTAPHTEDSLNNVVDIKLCIW